MQAEGRRFKSVYLHHQSHLPHAGNWLFLLEFTSFQPFWPPPRLAAKIECSDRCSDKQPRRTPNVPIRRRIEPLWPPGPDAPGSSTAAATTPARSAGNRAFRGRRQQHKFLLKTDRQQAEIRERKLREIWAAAPVAVPRTDGPVEGHRNGDCQSGRQGQRSILGFGPWQSTISVKVLSRSRPSR